MHYQKTLSLITVEWYYPDGTAFMDSGEFEFDPDKKEIHVYGDNSVENPIYFNVSAGDSYTNDLIQNYDLIEQEDFQKWIIKGIDQVVNPQSIDGLSVRLMRKIGVFELVVESINTVTPSTPNGPAEYDFEVYCNGILGLNYIITENPDYDG